MWEDAAPRQTPAAGKPAENKAPPARPAQKRAEKPESCVLWVQILLCAAVLATVLAARSAAPQLLQKIRTAYTAALAEPGPLLAEERQFVKFAQETLAAFRQAAGQVMAGTSQEPPAVPAGAAVAHAKPQKQTPGGCRTESYLPDFPLVYPLPATTWTTSGYGWRTDPVQGAGDDFHTGMDLHADEGTPVLAAADGVVRRAGRGATYGNYLRVLHANGDETLYAHMQYLFVRSGQSVHAGEVLGTVGHTGNVTGPHLHFELLHEGWRYDPTELLAAAAEG